VKLINETMGKESAPLLSGDRLFILRQQTVAVLSSTFARV